MKTIRITIFFLFTFLLLSGVLVSAEENSISEWAIDEVTEAIDLGFIPEDMQGQYTEDITRAEFAKIAVNFLALQYRISEGEVCNYYANNTPRPQDENGFDILPFSDTTDEYYVGTAYNCGIVKGRGNGIFDPDSPITREEAAQMLYNTYLIYAETLAEIDNTSVLNVFSDRAAISSWAEDAAAFVINYNVMNGISEDEFSAKTHYTREQCYVTFLRLYNNAPCSRLYGTAKNLWTYDEMVEDIVGEYSYELIYSCETETCTVLYGKHTAARTNSHRLWIVYKSGGRKQIMEQLLYPDHIFLENFSLSEDMTTLYCTQMTTGELYKIDLETATVEINPK